jgi:hypothetical protein
MEVRRWRWRSPQAACRLAGQAVRVDVRVETVEELVELREAWVGIGGCSRGAVRPADVSREQINVCSAPALRHHRSRTHVAKEGENIRPQPVRVFEQRDHTDQSDSDS